MEAAVKEKGSFAGYLLTFLGAVLFSTKAILVKLAFAHTAVDVITLLALRMICSLPFYLATVFLVSAKSKAPQLTPRQWLLTLLVGLMGYYISSLFDFLGLQYISAGMERLILFLYPTFVVLINAFFFKQKIRPKQLVALLFTYAGIALVFLRELRVDGNTHSFILGSTLVFLCAITYSVYIVGSGRLIPQIGDTRFTAYTMLAATVGILLHFMAGGNYQSLGQSASFWWYGVLLAIVATVTPSFLLASGVKKIGSNNAAIISSIGPVSTIVQADYFLGEPVYAEQIIGALLVISGVLILSIKK